MLNIGCQIFCLQWIYSGVGKNSLIVCMWCNKASARLKAQECKQHMLHLYLIGHIHLAYYSILPPPTKLFLQPFILYDTYYSIHKALSPSTQPTSARPEPLYQFNACFILHKPWILFHHSPSSLIILNWQLFLTWQTVLAASISDFINAYNRWYVSVELDIVLDCPDTCYTSYVFVSALIHRPIMCLQNLTHS